MRGVAVAGSGTKSVKAAAPNGAVSNSQPKNKSIRHPTARIADFCNKIGTELPIWNVRSCAAPRGQADIGATGSTKPIDEDTFPSLMN